VFALLPRFYLWFPVDLRLAIGVELVSCRVEADDALSTLPQQPVTHRPFKRRQIVAKAFPVVVLNRALKHILFLSPH
jgi:hypothetical protein